MGNKGRSEPNLFGGYTHYDSKGHKTGRTEPGFFGGYNHYDAKGNKVGHSDPGLFGGYNHTMQRGIRLDIPIRVPLAATITMTAKVIRMGEVILFWVDTPTVTQMAAMLPPVSMAPMIHRRFGHSAVSGTIIWADAHGVVPLFGHTMP